jgi:F-type H+-transporting ATPase subunit epsilon
MIAFTCTIITPAGTIVDKKPIVSATIPTTTGGIMVFAQHQPLITALSLGKITLELEYGIKEYYITSEGIVRITPRELLILPEIADPDSDTIKDLIAKSYEKAQKHETSSLSSPELLQLEKRLRYQRFYLDMHNSD